MSYQTFSNHASVPASSFHISPTASVHAPPSLADDCESVADENDLDSPHASAMSPTTHDQRRQSYPSTVPFSSDPSAWPELLVHSEPSSAGPQQYFFEQNPQAFPHPTPHHQPFNSNMQWQSQPGIGVCAPAPPASFEPFAPTPDYDVKDPSILHHDHVPPPTSEFAGFGASSMDAAPSYQTKPESSTSPRSDHSWATNDHADLRNLPKEQLAGVFNTNPPLLRRDGIRKKNARFEIPAERTLRTIDQMIANSTDEQTIKELKQQKRLLRNRQAALDSRQRKKQHTERLEEEKKQTSSIMNELEEALSDLRLRELEWSRQREAWMTAEEHYKRYIDDMVLDKEELIRRHTVETTDLRRKNAALTEQVQKLESLPLSTVPSSNGYATDFSDFGNLTMESSPWDNFHYEFSPGQEPASKQDTALVMLPKKDITPQPSATHGTDARATEREGATSGLLLMLLLCGAWVASQSDTSSISHGSSAAPIPRIPDDVRVASTAVLESIYHDAGIQPAPGSAAAAAGHSSSLHRSSSVQTSFNIKDSPTPTPANPSAYPPHQSSFSSSLQSLHHRLITPSAEQHRAQAFGLTSEQYNALSEDADGEADVDDEHTPLHDPPVPVSGHRRNLRDVLASLRQNQGGANGGGASEAYTRSLLWNEIQPDVVRDFARMVQARGSEPTA